MTLAAAAKGARRMLWKASVPYRAILGEAKNLKGFVYQSALRSCQDGFIVATSSERAASP